MKGYLKSVVPLGLAVSVILLGGTAMLSYRSIIDQVETADWVTHTHIVLERLETLRADLVKAESARRGFVLTKENDFSEEFSAARAAIQKAVRQLRTLTADNASQQKRPDEIEPQLAERLSVLEGSIDDLPSGKAGASEQVRLTIAATASSNRIVAVINTMESAERALLQQRDAAAKASAARLKIIVLAGTLVSVALLLGVFIILSREVADRRRAEELLKASEAMFRQLIDSAPDAIVGVDSAGSLLIANAQAEKLFGYDRKELLGQKLEVLLPDRHRDIHVRHRAGYVADPHNRSMGAGLELHGRRKDGTEFPVDISLSSLHTKDGLLVTAIIQDITKRKHAEERIRLLNQDLERRAHALEEINKELEAFTYSVSHDLRAPLRHVDGFSRLLLEEHGEQLSPEGKRMLERVRQGTQHMGALVDDLLNLSRVTRREANPLVTDLNTIVEEVLTELKPTCQSRQVEFRAGRLPFAQCDPGLIRQVFANLLSNAVKFTRPRERALIEVGQTQNDGRSAVFVRDNGVGFSMKYADKLFGVFQRLHRAEDFEGTGVGLATVQRIIEKHGGRIWAEAEIDKGATFYFTLEGLEDGYAASPEMASGERSAKG